MLFLEPAQTQTAPTQDGLNVRIYLTAGSFSLGRPLKGNGTGQTDIVLYGDSSISKVHGEITVTYPTNTELAALPTEATFTVSFVDKSRYGSYINDDKVQTEQATRLHVGDALKLSPKTKFTLAAQPMRLLIPSNSSSLNEAAHAAACVGASVITSFDEECTHVMVGEGEEASSVLGWALCAQTPVVTVAWLKAILQLRLPRSCLPAEANFQPSNVLLPDLDSATPGHLVPVTLHALVRPAPKFLVGYTFSSDITCTQDAALKAAIESLGGQLICQNDLATGKHVHILATAEGAEGELARSLAPMYISRAALLACILLGRDPASTKAMQRSTVGTAPAAATPADSIEDITDDEEEPIEMSVDQRIAVGTAALAAASLPAGNAPKVSVVASLLSNLLSDDEDDGPGLPRHAPPAAAAAATKPTLPAAAPSAPAMQSGGGAHAAEPPAAVAPAGLPAAAAGRKRAAPAAAAEAVDAGEGRASKYPRRGASTPTSPAGAPPPSAAPAPAPAPAAPPVATPEPATAQLPAPPATAGATPTAAAAAHTTMGGATAAAATPAVLAWGTSEIVFQALLLPQPPAAATSVPAAYAGGTNFKRFIKQRVAKVHQEFLQVRVEAQRVGEEDAALVEQHEAAQRTQRAADDLFDAQLRARKAGAPETAQPARRVRA